MTIDEQIAEMEARDYGGHMPAHNKKTLRLVLERQQKADEKYGELSLRDYLPADEGMHWSD